MLWELLSLALVGAAVGALAGGLLTSVALGREHRVTIFTVGILFAAMLALGHAIFHRARALRTGTPPPD
jgi:hypothetical protein